MIDKPEKWVNEHYEKIFERKLLKDDNSKIKKLIFKLTVK